MRLKLMFAVILFVGCDQGAPPFDELPLRDALRAEPEVVAALPENARTRLAARLETARVNDIAIDEVDASQAAGPATLVAALDRARQRRQSEPLMVGVLGNGAGWPIRDCAVPSHAPALPPFEGPPATATATMETRALETEAGAAVRGLLAASGAHHLVRVVGWPVGAVAIDDAVYVNAAWLVSLAPSGDQKIDGGAWDGSANPGGAAAGGTAKAVSGGAAEDPNGAAPTSGIDRPARILGAWPSANQGDAGTAPQPSSPGAPPIVDPVDTCSACASGCDTSSGDSCAASGDDGGDSCDASADDGSSADSCNSASSDGGDACSAAADSGAGAASCQISRGHGHQTLATRLWLLAPLAFLLLRRRS